jgi:hypothetical protein
MTGLSRRYEAINSPARTSASVGIAQRFQPIPGANAPRNAEAPEEEEALSATLQRLVRQAVYGLTVACARRGDVSVNHLRHIIFESPERDWRVVAYADRHGELCLLSIGGESMPVPGGRGRAGAWIEPSALHPSFPVVQQADRCGETRRTEYCCAPGRFIDSPALIVVRRMLAPLTGRRKGPRAWLHRRQAGAV